MPDLARTSTTRRRAVVTLAALAGLLALLVGQPPAGLAYPPTPPSAAQTSVNLDTLTVEAEDGAGYDRDAFEHWIIVSGSCDAREEVLQRDGSGVTVDDDCQPVTGSWYSVYDQVWVEDSSDVDIDHVVPLAEAWGSGADDWSDARREDFANDLTEPQLIASSASSNRSKSDGDPAEWKPTNTGNWCLYARNWVQVKFAYDLSVDTAEKSALEDMLASC